MNGRHKRKTTMLLLITTLFSVAFLVVKTFNIVAPDNNHHIASAKGPDLHNNQGNNRKGVTDELIPTPIIEQITASPNTLWPADKRMVSVSLNVVAAPMTGWKIARVVRNETEYGTDDGSDGPDAIFLDQTLKLRAERNKESKIRTYTVYVRVYNIDPSGSEASALAKVDVKVPIAVSIR